MTKTRLKELRKKYKYTQTDVANMLEISQTQYFKEFWGWNTVLKGPGT